MFPVSLESLKTMEIDAARQLIVEAFRLGNIDANQAFCLAAECSIELEIV